MFEAKPYLIMGFPIRPIRKKENPTGSNLTNMWLGSAKIYDPLQICDENELIFLI
jgi:hypothetical protein